MTARSLRREGRPAFAVIEEAVVLLRRTSVATWLAFYLGAGPFWLALLYFVADMARSAFAEEHAASASLLVALLYLWKKCWHAAVAAHWRAQLLGERAPRWSPARLGRLIAAQATVQPWGLLLRPVAWLLTLPAGWVSAFYQHVTVTGSGEPSATRRALQQTLLWPRQLHALYGVLALFSFFVWLNVGVVLGALPSLLKTYTGIETMASRSSEAWLANGTFPLVVTALAVLCVEPLWKAVFVLRTLQAESISSGADLRMRLQSLRRAALALLLALAPLAGAAEPAPAPAAAPTELNSRIDRVLQRREYAWRLPREHVSRPPERSTWPDAVISWFKKMRDRLRDWFRGREETPGAEGSGSFLPAKEILYALLALVVLALVWAGWRGWRRRGAVVQVTAVAEAIPDLQAESVLASELPEEGWLRLMREMLERGDLRLALRAAYLGCLAHLAERQLLSIARHKSNRDYARELRRRARAREALLAAFAENLQAFERVWYGRAGFSASELAHFTANLERMRAC